MNTHENNKPANAHAAVIQNAYKYKFELFCKSKFAIDILANVYACAPVVCIVVDV